MKRIVLLLTIILYGSSLFAQDIEANIQDRLQSFFREYTTTTVNMGTCKLDSFRINHQKKKLLIYADESFPISLFGRKQWMPFIDI